MTTQSDRFAEFENDLRLKALILELRNRNERRWHELGQAVRVAIAEADQEAAEFAKANPGGTKHFDPFLLRYASYIRHATQVGDDFLNAFDELMVDRYGFISDNLKVWLTILFNKRYEAAITRLSSDLKQVLASKGRNTDDDFKPNFLSLNGLYQRERHRCYNLLEAEIAKHNADIETKQVREQKDTPQNDMTGRVGRAIVEHRKDAIARVIELRSRLDSINKELEIDFIGGMGMSIWEFDRRKKSFENERIEIIYELDQWESKHPHLTTLVSSVNTRQQTKAKKHKRKLVSLQRATVDIRDWQKKRKWVGFDRIDVCAEYLKKHQIIGKPNYEAGKLNNRVAQQVIKEKNRSPANR